MIYQNSEQRITDMDDFFGGKPCSYRMAKVMALSNGRPVIRFNGETADSAKMYRYLSSYTPAVGDYVLLAVTARTYVILGKVV